MPKHSKGIYSHNEWMIIPLSFIKSLKAFMYMHTHNAYTQWHGKEESRERERKSRMAEHGKLKLKQNFATQKIFCYQQNKCWINGFNFMLKYMNAFCTMRYIFTLFYNSYFSFFHLMQNACRKYEDFNNSLVSTKLHLNMSHDNWDDSIHKFHLLITQNCC